jgi:hypothetical protein
MKILIGTGNAVSTTLDVTAKTLTFAGAYNFDIVPEGSFQVYSTTASKYLYDAFSLPSITATASNSFVAGLNVQVVTFSAIPSGIADGDTLVIYLDAPDNVATYNAIITAV